MPRLNLSQLDCVKCTTDLEVQLLGALIVERRRRMRLERPQIAVAKPVAPKPPAPVIEPPLQQVQEVQKPPVSRPAGGATVREIQAAVARRFGLTINDLRSERREVDVALARHVTVWLCHALTLHSYPKLGRWFNRDHTTMVNSVAKMRESLSGLLSEHSRNEPLDAWVDDAFKKVVVQPTNGHESVVQSS